MNILQVIPRLDPILGGGVNVVYNVSKELVSRGHSVTILTTKRQLNNITVEKLAALGVKTIPFDYLFDLHLFIFSPSMEKWVRNNITKFDLIHLNGARSYQNNVVVKYAHSLSVPFVLQPHGSIRRIVELYAFKYLFDLFWGRKVFRNAAKVIALNKSEANACISMGIDNNHIDIIPNGIDLNEFNCLPEKGIFRAKYTRDKEDKIVLYLGRLHKSKGLDLLICAFANIAIRRKNVLLIMVGPDGVYKKHLLKLIRKLKLENKVIFTGAVSDFEKKCALIDSDVFVTPKFYGFPITFLEAMACGIPIVTTNIGDNLENIHGNFGYVTNYTSHDLSLAIDSILMDYSLRKRFSSNEKMAIREYDWKRIVEKIENSYFDFLKANPKRIVYSNKQNTDYFVQMC